MQNKHVKRVALFTTILALASPFMSLAATFSDVPESNPDYKAIEYLKAQGFISGYPDGTFKPAQIVNRAEAIKIILSAKGIATKDATTTSFKDVAASDWFAKYVETAKALAIVNGNPDGTFAPARNVNKVELLKMLLLAYEVKFVNYQPPVKPLYADTPDSKQWYISYLDFAKNVNIISPDSNNNINPSKDLTRGEVASIVYKLVIIIKGGPTQLLLSRAEAALMQAIFDLQANKLDDASADVNNAANLASEALKKSPDETVVQAAVKVISAFDALVSAFKNSAAKKYEDALKDAGNAYNLAEAARQINPSVNNLAEQVKSASKSLADNIRSQPK